MTAIALGLGSYKRTEGRLPPSRCVNLYVEATPTKLNSKVSLLNYPGMVRSIDGLDGAFRGLFQQAGSFSGDMIAVAGTKAYRISGAETELGDIPGTDRTWIAANATIAYITTGPGAYSTDGVTVSTLATPDSLGFSTVGYINGYFLFSQTGTSRFYWLEPGETVIDPLNFANAERGPDAILAIIITGDEIWLFGEETTEVWIPTGDADAPFQRVGGRMYEVGTRSADSVVKMDNSIYFTGNDGIAYRADQGPVRVSENGIEERIALSSYIEAWTFSLDGHAFYALTLGDEGTFMFDPSTGQWSERSTYGQDVWRARVGVNVGTSIYAGDNAEGILWAFDRNSSQDDDGPLIRVATAGVAVDGTRGRCDSFALDCTSGTTTDPTANPVATLRISDDGGNNWRNMGQARIGKMGKFSHRVRWPRLGLMKPPGRIFEVSMSDPNPWRVSSASINDVF